MKLARTPFFTSLRLLALAFACTTSIAYADDYGDVNQLLQAGKLGEAMVKADNYLATKPADPQMRFLKGVIQRNLGKQAEAIATFTKLTEDYPELPEPYNNLAVLYAGQNQFDKARAALEMAIRTNPSYATAHENLGDIYARLASQAYNKALQLDGTNPAVPPKLALIRELFGPNNKGQRPATAVLAAAPAAAVAKPSTPTPSAPSAVVAPAPSATTAPVAAAKPAASDSTAKESKEVEEAVQAWARAWAAKDITAYLGAYGKGFDPAGKQSRNAWETERRNRIVGKNAISVKLDNVSITVHGSQAVAKFRQDYRSGTLSVSSRKTLDLVKTGNRWLIVKESTGN